MDIFIQSLTFMALLGSAVVAGVFFAFSSFIMGALAQRPAQEGMAAMQSINVVVINPLFLGAFMGTALTCLVLGGMVVLGQVEGEKGWLLAGSVAYLVGTFGVTGLGNVPLNNALADADPASAEGHALWEHYLERWTRLNTIRTVAGVVAAASFLAAW